MLSLCRLNNLALYIKPPRKKVKIKVYHGQLKGQTDGHLPLQRLIFHASHKVGVLAVEHAKPWISENEHAQSQNIYWNDLSNQNFNFEQSGCAFYDISKQTILKFKIFGWFQEFRCSYISFTVTWVNRWLTTLTGVGIESCTQRAILSVGATHWFCGTKIYLLFIYWRLIAQSTAQGHLKAFDNLKFLTKQNMHIIIYTNIKHINIIRKLVPSALLS